MYVIKANGKKEEFNPEKIRGSLTRARVDRAISDKIIEQVEKEVFGGISTGAIFKRVMALLNESLPSRANVIKLSQNSLAIFMKLQFPGRSLNLPLKLSSWPLTGLLSSLT